MKYHDNKLSVNNYVANVGCSHLNYGPFSTEYFFRVPTLATIVTKLVIDEPLSEASVVIFP